MQAQPKRWKTMGMTAVLGAVIYSGLLLTTRYEVSQTMAELDCAAPAANAIKTSYQGHGNAAPLYAAATRLQDGKQSRGAVVRLEEFRQNRASVEALLVGQELAFELLRVASRQSRCHLSYQQAYEGGDLLGYRALVQAACLEMMRMAEQNQAPQAIALAEDVQVMIERLENSPTALRHAVCLVLTEQLASTIGELQAAYPGQGFEKLTPELARLAEVLDTGLTTCPKHERDFVAAEFEKILAGDLTGTLVPATRFGLATDLQVYLAQRDYLRLSREAEAALAAPLEERENLMETLEAGNSVAAEMTPNWAHLALRHQDVLRGLRALKRQV